MPNTEDLKYQPQVQPSIYKESGAQSFKKLTWKLSSIFLPILTIFIVVASIIFIVNYFNIFSLSYFYPQFFSWLPHRYDRVANTQALTGLPYYPEFKAYQIEANFNSFSTNLVTVNYKGKILQFLTDSNTQCFKILSQNNSSQIFCSDLLTNKNKGKKVILRISTNSNGENLVKLISIE